MKAFIAALIAISLATGCHYGPKIENLNLASSPRGASVQVTKVNGEVRGELLAVNDDGLIVLGRDWLSVQLRGRNAARSGEACDAAPDQPFPAGHHAGDQGQAPDDVSAIEALICFRPR